MKKTFKWLDENKISYDFHDYKKQDVDITVLKATIAEHGWESVINKRGTTWRKLDDKTKETMDETQALEVVIDNPSIIKRPLMIVNSKAYLGFSSDSYQEILGA